MSTLSAFDRMIFKGRLTGLFPHARFLARQGVLLKDFGTYVEQTTGTLKAYAQALAEEAGCPFIPACSRQAPGRDGARLMSAALHCRNKEFPRFVLAAA